MKRTVGKVNRRINVEIRNRFLKIKIIKNRKEKKWKKKEKKEGGNLYRTAKAQCRGRGL